MAQCLCPALTRSKEIAGAASTERLDRGVLVHVEGRLRASRYTAADGTERVFTEVVATSLKVIEE